METVGLLANILLGACYFVKNRNISYKLNSREIRMCDHTEETGFIFNIATQNTIRLGTYIGAKERTALRWAQFKL